MTNRFTGGRDVDYNALNTTAQSLRLVVAGGLDVFHQNNQLWAPNELFFEQPQTLPGAAIDNDGDSKYYNWNLNGVHIYHGGSWSLNTSAGLQYEDRQLPASRIETTNLIPGQRNVGQGTKTIGADI